MYKLYGLDWNVSGAQVAVDKPSSPSNPDMTIEFDYDFAVEIVVDSAVPFAEAQTYHQFGGYLAKQAENFASARGLDYLSAWDAFLAHMMLAREKRQLAKDFGYTGGRRNKPHRR